MLAQHDCMIGKELGPSCYHISRGKHQAGVRGGGGGGGPTTLSRNSPALTTHPKISTVSEMNYRTSWQSITEIQERIRAFVTLVAGNKLQEFGELQSHIIALS